MHEHKRSMRRPQVDSAASLRRTQSIDHSLLARASPEPLRMTDSATLTAAAATAAAASTAVVPPAAAPAGSIDEPPELQGPRGLEGGAEAVGRWARFIEACFAFKSPPPSCYHFLRRLNQDPHSGGAQRPDMIRVVQDGQGNIVAAARICYRQLQVPGDGRATPQAGAGGAGRRGQEKGEIVWAVGIAEVCVSPDHRGKGLAKRVVEDALAHAVSQRPDVRVSLLHCQPPLVPVYKAMGYASHPVPWRRLRLPRTPTAVTACADALRHIGRYHASALSSSADLDEIAQLHASLPPADRGVICRPPSYWEYWVQGELSAMSGAPNPVWGVRDERGQLVAYAVFRPPPFSPTDANLNNRTDKDSELVVLDMGCVAEEKGRARLFLRALALAAARTCPVPGGVHAVRYPAAALPPLVTAAGGEAQQQQKEEEEEQEEEEEVVVQDDPGWMYRCLGGGEEGQQDGAYQRLRAWADEGRHLLWPIDHF